MGSPFEVLENTVITLDVYTGGIANNPQTGNPEPEKIPLVIRAYLKAERLAPESILQPGVNLAIGIYKGYAIEPKFLPDSVGNNSVGVAQINREFTNEDGSKFTSTLQGQFTLQRGAPRYADQFTGTPISGILVAKSL